MRQVLLAFAMVCLAWCGVAAGASPEVPASAPAAAEASADEAVLTVLNRPVAVFRAPMFGASPQERVRRTRRVIGELLARGGPGQVTIQHEAVGSVFLIDGELALLLIPQDADALSGETLPVITASAQRALVQAIAETRESRDHRRLLRAALWSVASTIGFALVVWVLWRLRGVMAVRAARRLALHTDGVRVAGAPLIVVSRVRDVVRWVFTLLFWAIVLLLCYQWLVFVLTQFAFTRAWGERLGSFLVGIAVHLGSGVVGAVPDLTVAVVIFLIAKLVVSALNPIFDRVQQGQSQAGWLDQDTVGPTRRLVQVAVWLFAMVMAYPYLPGSDSDAFKGVSVLVGVMITLGGSSLLSQGASGLILMYSRTLRVGEFVRIGDQEGTVTELRAFTTRLRTGLGEEVSIPNALVLGTPTKNYSRTVKGPGYIVDTVVTIGYDTPWRQVHELLLGSAARTEGVLADPSPRVFQTALSDFYVEYRLVAQAIPEEPRPRAELLSVLHANVLDSFNAAGVQIMSPHYFADPAEPKVVPGPR